VNGRLDAVTVLLKLGVDPNVRDRTGASPLHYAVIVKENAITKRLLEAGAKSNAVTIMQETPLMIAAKAGAMQAIPMLVGGEGDSIAVDRRGQTALHYAAQQPSLDVFVFLLNAGWDPYQIDDEKRSPLYYALSQTQLVSYILAHRLDLTQISCVDKFSNPGLRFRVLRLLLCYLDKATRTSFLAMETVNGDTIFTRGAIYGGLYHVHACIKAGAQLEATRNNGDTALLATCRAGQLSSAAYLVRQGAKLEYEHQGRTLNAYLAACGHPEIIRWLLVERWTEQGKLGSESANSGEQAQCQSWTGVRTVKIPLRGDFERPKGSSLFDHAKYLHEVAKEGWRILVPLGWDTVANLVPLPGEA
jgi:ankyrin repeat protein